MGNFYDVIHYFQGRVYADTGEVVDVSDPTNPARGSGLAPSTHSLRLTSSECRIISDSAGAVLNVERTPRRFDLGEARIGAEQRARSHSRLTHIRSIDALGTGLAT